MVIAFICVTQNFFYYDNIFGNGYLYWVKSRCSIIWEVWQSLCSEISSRETRNVKQRIVSSGKRCIAFFFYRGMLEVDIVFRPVTFVLFVYLRPHLFLLDILMMSPFFSLNL